jgi:hypothetical protein
MLMLQNEALLAPPSLDPGLALLMQGPAFAGAEEMHSHSAFLAASSALSSGLFTFETGASDPSSDQWSGFIATLPGDPPSGSGAATLDEDAVVGAWNNYDDANGNGEWDEGEDIYVIGDKEDELNDNGEGGGYPGGETGGTGTGGDGGWGGTSQPEPEPNDCRDRAALEAEIKN